MVNRFYVPKYITIEDKLAGLVTFKQLFALLGAFLLTVFVFKFNQFLGIIVGLISFGIAFVFTFVKINGKPFINIFPSFLSFVFGSRKYIWQRREVISYKKIEIPEIPEVETELKIPEIRPREVKIPKELPTFQEQLRLIYKEELKPIPKEEIETKLTSTEITEKEIKTTPKEQISIELTYPEIAPQHKEKVVISLQEPLSVQTERINKIIYPRLVNPKNPYRLFPYVKFYRRLK